MSVDDHRQARQMLYRLGRVFARCGQIDSAIDCYHAVERPDMVGDLLMANGRLDQAIACYKQSMNWKLGRALFVKGEYSQALNVFAVDLQTQKQLRALWIDRRKFGNGPEDAIRHLIMSGEAVEQVEFRSSQFEDARIRILSEFKARWARITSLQGNDEVETDAPDECDHKAGQFRRDVAACEECDRPMVPGKRDTYLLCSGRPECYHSRQLIQRQDCLIILVGLRQCYGRESLGDEATELMKRDAVACERCVDRFGNWTNALIFLDKEGTPDGIARTTTRMQQRSRSNRFDAPDLTCSESEVEAVTQFANSPGHAAIRQSILEALGSMDVNDAECVKTALENLLTDLRFRSESLNQMHREALGRFLAGIVAVDDFSESDEVWLLRRASHTLGLDPNDLDVISSEQPENEAPIVIQVGKPTDRRGETIPDDKKGQFNFSSSKFGKMV